MKKILKISIILILLSIIYIYTVAIDAIPNNIVIFEGETISVNSMLGLKVNEEETILTNARKRKHQQFKNTNNEIKLIR